MASLITNARQIAAMFADRSKRWDAALAKGIRKAAIAVENEASDRLSGSGVAFTYPVPVRTGHLRRSLGVKTSRTGGEVFNTATYAFAVHEGKVGWWARGKVRRKGVRNVTRRPFLEDALKAADPGLIIQATMRAAL